MPKDKKNPPILNAGRTAPGQVRVIGGLWKRSNIPVKDALGLRPTPERVRETLFNWIGPSIVGSHCLDLFAGSGALGLEALSRGAAWVQFNETNAQALASLRALLLKLQQPPFASWQFSGQDALQALKDSRLLAQMEDRKLDFAFLDPPFGHDWLLKVVPRLAPLLAPAAKIYIESEAPFAYPGLNLLKSGKAGQVHYHLFQNALVQHPL